ncbi:MAG: GTP-binding protein [Legionellaceae bacterium]|nr:GTP-binding protein [Legionellaceae bacterium]
MKYRFEYPNKVLFVGSEKSGKTQLITALNGNVFNDDYTPTIGVDFLVSRTTKVNRINIKNMFFDTSGKERFHFVGKSYVKKSQTICIVVDLSDVKFNLITHVQKYEQYLIEGHATSNVNVVIIANKQDVFSPEDAEKRAELEQYACDKNIKYFEVSAKTGAGIDALKTHITDTLVSTNLESEKLLSLIETPMDTFQFIEDRAKEAIDKIDCIIVSKFLSNKEKQCLQFIAKKLRDTLSDSTGPNSEEFDKFWSEGDGGSCLEILQFGSIDSLVNTVLNAIACVLLCLNKSRHNYNEQQTGNPNLFFTFGAKQRAEIAINLVKKELVYSDAVMSV